MTKIYSTLLSVLSILFFNYQSWGTHAAGGELTYSLVPGTTNTYQFIFKFYRDCGANGQFTSTEPANFTLCYTNTCTNQLLNVTMPKIVGNIPTTPPVPNGSPLNNGCNSVTTCDNINSLVHGYRQWWYSATIILPSTCNNWRFWTTLCCRNDITGNITTPPGSQNIYVECTFDNTVSQTNSSPVFTNSNSPSSLPVPYVCINMPYTHNGGATDADGDSLVFETLAPRTFGGCGAGVPNNILLPAFNILNTAGNPLPTNNTYNLSSTNGFFNFTPGTIGYYVLCIKVSEYRSGALIGTSMRDMQVVVDNCTPLPIVSQLDSLSIVNGELVQDTVTTCPESDLAFCFDIIDQVNPTATVSFMSADNATVLPGSTLTTTNPQSNILKVCVTWKSGIADSGLRWLSVLVKDTLDCLTSAGISKIPIMVRVPLRAWGDTSICYGDTTALGCYGNGFYSWNVLPGGDDLNSLSCTNCANPRVWPEETTTYEVTDLLCGFKKTVTIIVFDKTAPNPSFTLTPEITTMENPTFTMVNKSTHALTYAWYDSARNYLGNTTDLTVTENKTGTYCYTLEAMNFCRTVRAVTKCAHILGDGALVFPTAFTPNNDGKNDRFLPVVVGDMSLTSYTFSIYNRWGMQLYTTRNLKDGWNGMFKGSECETETYFYYVEAYKALGQKLSYKGEFLLLR